MKKTINTWVEFIIFSIFLIPIVVNDIRNRRIPDIFIYSCLAIILILRIVFQYNLSYWIMVNFLTGFFFIWVIRFLTGGKIGLGDAKLSALVALILGLANWLLTLFIAAVSGIIFGATRNIKTKIKNTEALPFAPFLAGGSIFSFFLGDHLIRIVYGINL